MKKFKILFFVLVLIIISGCSVDSKVVINSDGKVSETVTFPVNNDGRTKDQMQNYFSNIIEVYSHALDARGYTSEITYGKMESEIIVSNEFDNICDYFEKTVFNQYIYKRISCIETENFYEIRNETEHIDYCYDCLTWPALDDAKLNISLPIRNAENNADYVKKNVYTWEFDEHTTKDKQIYLKINKKALNSAISNKENYEIIKSILIYAIAIVAIIAACRHIFLKLYKKYKENNLEY